MALVSRFLISSDSDNADVGWDNDGWLVTMLGMLTELVTGVLLLTITELLLTTHGTEVVTTTAADTAGTAGAGEGELVCAAGACNHV